MRIAFYAPLQPPDHLTPSGDRTVGRALLAAMDRGGYDVRIASPFRSFDAGDSRRQERLASVGARLAERLASRFEAGAWRPDLWFTYHLYHKAPDWLGPSLADRLRIPYAVAEASFAPKQAGGVWALGHAAVANALRRADRVFSPNPADVPCVLPLLRRPEVLVPLPAFLDTAPFRSTDRDAARKALDELYGAGEDSVWLMTAAMMRHDQKLLSYRLLAQSLSLITDLPWRLVIAGFGPAEPEVRAAFAAFGARVAWVGEAEPAILRGLYAGADLLVWPAIKEAWGMVLLEAQAAGTPVVAGRSGGVASVVAAGVTGLLPPEGDAAAFAEAVRTLVVDPHRRRNMGQAAMSLMAVRHDISVASEVLTRELTVAVEQFRA